jgi:hypothetical protein
VPVAFCVRIGRASRNATSTPSLRCANFGLRLARVRATAIPAERVIILRMNPD